MLDQPRLNPDLLQRFAAIVGEKYAITDARRAGALSGRDARSLSRPHAAGAAAGLGCGSGGHPQARQRDQNGDRAAGRQYRPGRRADPASRRGAAVAHPARQDPRGRCGLQHHDGGGRRHACSARARRRREPTGSIRSCCPRKAPAPSAAISPPMPAAWRRWRTASRARTRSGWKWCWPTGACCTISTS